MSPSTVFCRVPTSWISDPSLCLFEWQTLIGGLLAVGAAVVSVIFLKKQISQTEQLHEAELKRRHNAVRSTIPIALAAISDFCDAISTQLASAIEDRNEGDFEAAFDAAAAGRDKLTHFQQVQIPSEVILTMQAFVETLADNRNVKHMAELLSSLQVLQSRFNSFKLQQVAAVHNLHSLLLDTAKVKLLIDSIYNYGRFVDETSFSVVNSASIDDAWQAILGKAHGLIFTRPIPDIFFPELNELVSSYKINQVSPWNEKFE